MRREGKYQTTVISQVKRGKKPKPTADSGMIPVALLSLTMLSNATIISIPLFTHLFSHWIVKIVPQGRQGVYHHPHFTDDEKKAREVDFSKSKDKFPHL